MAKTPSKKTAKTAKKASTEGKKKRKSKRTETFNTYLYKVRRPPGWLPPPARGPRPRAALCLRPRNARSRSPLPRRPPFPGSLQVLKQVHPGEPTAPVPAAPNGLQPLTSPTPSPGGSLPPLPPLPLLLSETGISKKGISILNSFINDIFDRVCTEAGKLTRYNKKATLSSREVQTAVRLVLPGELAKHAVSEGTKAVTKFTSA
jgi:hypothetical protein